jgi:hypothetical protein
MIEMVLVKCATQYLIDFDSVHSVVRIFFKIPARRSPTEPPERCSKWFSTSQ